MIQNTQYAIFYDIKENKDNSNKSRVFYIKI